mgnify:CR=1 FL=1
MTSYATLSRGFADGIGSPRHLLESCLARIAERHGLDGRARFAVGDWLAPIQARFDLVASNPPYIPRGEIPGLAVDVRDFDPDIALDGGMDGLDAYRRIFSGLDHILAVEGMAFFESAPPRRMRFAPSQPIAAGRPFGMPTWPESTGWWK